MVRRDYIVLACRDAKSLGQDDKFAVAVRNLNISLGSTTLVADKPPPEREVALSVVMTELEGAATRSLLNTFSFQYDAALILDSPHSVRMDFQIVADGIMRRAIRDNDGASYYGLKAIAFAEGLDAAGSSALFNYLCMIGLGIKDATGVSVACDVATSGEELRILLVSEHRRLVFGDIRNQYASSK
ncbi:hypothetical protein EOA30_01420 [Mesorhizobium sp. M8A.F.Ca.ET.059.01.1.1]|nr:hypothetical protein EOA30_01420 [Mesorhizobium sp. M8A.F.Ca.ET.059.01.1.1]